MWKKEISQMIKFPMISNDFHDDNDNYDGNDGNFDDNDDNVAVSTGVEERNLSDDRISNGDNDAGKQ